MITNKRVYGRAMSMPAGIGIGTAISLVILLAWVGLLALLLHRETMDMDSLGYGMMASLVSSSFAGAWISMKVIKRRFLLVCTVQAICFYGILLLINGLVFGGVVSGAAVTALLILGGAGSAVLICTGGRQKKRLGFKKLRTG